MPKKDEAWLRELDAKFAEQDRIAAATPEDPSVPFDITPFPGFASGGSVPRETDGER